MNLTFYQPTQKQFVQICKYIKKYELDGRDMCKEQFIVATFNLEIVGFGRLRKFKNYNELCSLAVVFPYRRKGIGKVLARELIYLSDKKIYLVCIIPEFFKNFDFNIVSQYPQQINKKWLYCSEKLKVEEEYVVMKREK